MVKELMHDPIFLAGKSEDATKEDIQVAQDLLETLMAHRESCVGMAANMIGLQLKNSGKDEKSLPLRLFQSVQKRYLTRPDGTRPILIAVTQLTSTSEERLKNDLLINETMENTVMHYAHNAKLAGLDGVVCSPLEAEKVHNRCGNDFVTVTPGVRFADGDKGDQVRVMTPAEAKRIGSDYIVVGRPITAADDPVAAYKRCVAEFVD